MLRVGVGVQQHDCHGFGLGGRKSLQQRLGGADVELAQYPVWTHPLWSPETQLRRHKWPWSCLTQAIQAWASLTPELDNVCEAVGRDERRARRWVGFRFEQSVRRDGHAVGEALGLTSLGVCATEHRHDRGHHALLLRSWRARCLGGVDGPVVADKHRVGERSTYIYPEQHRPRRLLMRRRGARCARCRPGVGARGSIRCVATARAGRLSPCA